MTAERKAHYNGENGAYRLHRAACRALGLPDYRLHDGRHSWAVRHIAAGVPAEYVAQQLGHASTEQTNAVYGRYRPTAHDVATYERLAEARDREQEAGG